MPFTALLLVASSDLLLVLVEVVEAPSVLGGRDRREFGVVDRLGVMRMAVDGGGLFLDSICIQEGLSPVVVGGEKTHPQQKVKWLILYMEGRGGASSYWRVSHHIIIIRMGL